jgi:heme oxygenase
VSVTLTRLEIATRPWQVAVDSTWHVLRRPAVTRADYLDALLRTFGFIAPLESACKYTAGIERWLPGPFTRAGMIAQDLVALGMVPSLMTRVPQCEEITTFRSVSEALGWLYVVKRAATVYEGLRSHLIARVPNLESGCSFLAATEGIANARLASFAVVVERVAAAEGPSEIVSAACDAFACARRWDLQVDREHRSAS